jgi:hypothetical protein
MFTLTFMEDTGSLPLFHLAVFDDMFTALRHVQAFIPGSHGWDWGFDGDTLYTEHDKTFTDAAGHLFRGSYSIGLA